MNRLIELDLLQVDLLASGASPFGREAADRERRSREMSSFVPRHMKSDEGLFWKSIIEPEINVPSTEVTTWHRRIGGVDWQDKRSLSCEIGTNLSQSIRTENDKIVRIADKNT